MQGKPAPTLNIAECLMAVCVQTHMHVCARGCVCKYEQMCAFWVCACVNACMLVGVCFLMSGQMHMRVYSVLV